MVDVAMSSKDHTTLVAAIKAADLINTLKGKGPFTVFAPWNSTFNRFPRCTVETLLKQESEADLIKLLTYNVVAANLKASGVLAAIKAGKRKAVIKTIHGENLTAKLVTGNEILNDGKSGKAMVTATDLTASNGIIHVINAILMPK